MTEDIVLDIPSYVLDSLDSVDLYSVVLPDVVYIPKAVVQKDTTSVELSLHLDNVETLFVLGLVDGFVPYREGSNTTLTIWFSKNIRDENNLLEVVTMYELDLYEMLSLVGLVGKTDG